LRAANVIIENLNKFLIEPLNADLYLLVQKTGTEIDNDINLFNTKNKIIYDPPDVTKQFINYHSLQKKDNYIEKACLQVYYNWYKFFETYGDQFENNYKYIIITRSDFLHLIPFPDLLNIYKNDDIFWSYDGHEWGGINGTLMCVPTKYIKNYLSSFYNYLQDSKNINTLNAQPYLNAETFLKIVFTKFKWTIGKIEPNAFITASSQSEITTWAKIKYNSNLKVYYKYEDQLMKAYNAFKKYTTNKKWSIVNINNTKHIVLLSGIPKISNIRLYSSVNQMKFRKMTYT
jgi:hypothetical protein